MVDQLTITAPIASEVYQIPVEEGEVVTPGLPLLSLVDLDDTWAGFSLREDLTAGLKIGDRFTVKIPALGNREVSAEVRVIAAKGEYAGWQATPPAISICVALLSVPIPSKRSTGCGRG